MKPWIYIFIITKKLNFAKMSVTTLLHSHDDLSFNHYKLFQQDLLHCVHVGAFLNFPGFS